jgi:hypothetical protein
MNTTWKELCPDGAVRYYEGDNPEGFVATIKGEFGFDPSDDPRWGELIETDSARFYSYAFHCPAESLDAI